MSKLKYIIGAVLIIYVLTVMFQIDNIDRATAEHIYSKSHYYNYDPK